MARPICAGCCPTAVRCRHGDWHDHAQRGIGVRIERPGRSAQPLLLLFNPGDRELGFRLPAGRWQLLLDSSAEAPPAPAVDCVVPARSLLLLQQED